MSDFLCNTLVLEQNTKVSLLSLFESSVQLKLIQVVQCIHIFLSPDHMCDLNECLI